MGVCMPNRHKPIGNTGNNGEVAKNQTLVTLLFRSGGVSL